MVEASVDRIPTFHGPVVVDLVVLFFFFFTAARRRLFDPPHRHHTGRENETET